MRIEGGQKKKKLVAKIVTAFFSLVLIVPSLAWIYPLTTEGAVLNVEILDNLAVNNTSGTTNTVRWPTSTLNQPVTFTITGKNLATVSVNLVGSRQAVLVIPAELANRVVPQVGVKGTADIRVLLDLTKISAVVNILNLVTTLLNTVSTILGDNPLLSVNLTGFNKAVADVYDLRNFMTASFPEDLTPSNGGRSLTMPLDKGLGPILANELSKRLTALSKAASELTVTGALPPVNAIANATLKTVVTPLTSAISTLVTELANPLGETVQQVVDAAVLGDTTIKMPTLVSGPTTLTNDYQAQFVGTVIKASLIDINLLSSSASKTSIYFSGERLTFQESLLPNSLNFGSHLIQTNRDETFTAKEGTLDTKGIVSLTETRLGTKKWQVKVNQESWQNAGKQLNTPRLKIYGGALTSNFSAGLVTGINQSAVELVNEQKEVLSLAQTTETGQVSLDLSKFELFIPKNTPKYKGNYQTIIRWTVTESP